MKNATTAIRHGTVDDAPTGYKRTEVGVILEEWEVKALSMAENLFLPCTWNNGMVE